MTDAPQPANDPAVLLRVGSRTFAIEPDRIYIVGSGDKADVRLVHGTVAASHATFSLHRGRLTIEDLGSESGTFIGEEKVEGERDVLPGSEVRFGSIAIQIETVAGVAAGSDQAVALAAAANQAAHHRDEPGFTELMAEELRRAPWFALSLAIHALLLLLAWMLAPNNDPIGNEPVVISIDPVESDEMDTGMELAAEEEFDVEEASDAAADLQDVEVDAIQEELDQEFSEFADAAPTADLLGPSDSMFAKLGGGGQDVLKMGGGGSGDGNWGQFGDAVRDLRGRGLEIVFVVDSTGSMGPVISATRRRMLRMLEALQELVRNKATIGIVTYRDTGQSEQYTTRSVPLSSDFFRAMNFMHTVSAAGGGDRPEAVLEGLEVATKQQFRKGSRRVVVLIGDAPAHEKTHSKLQRLVKRFSRDGRSHVHAIMTTPDVLGIIEADTKDSFQRIAKAGDGVCVAFENEKQILRQVLSLAIGSKYRESINEVYRILDSQERSVPRRVRDAIKKVDEKRLRGYLERGDDAVTRAMARSKNAPVLEILVDVLADEKSSPRARQAASWALREALGLRTPPVPAEGDTPLDPSRALEFKRLVRRL